MVDGKKLVCSYQHAGQQYRNDDRNQNVTADVRRTAGLGIDDLSGHGFS